MKKGVYEHYKGKQYRVIGVGNHSEDLSKMVIYESLYDTEDFPKGTLWIRPLTMFNEEIEVNGTKVPRFRFIKE